MYSPNLKPKSLHTHVDKAQKLGVPRSNVVDLRAQVEAKSEQLRAEPSDASALAKASQNTKLSWLERRAQKKQQRLLSEQRRASVAVLQSDEQSDGSVPENFAETVTETIQAAPIPEVAKLHHNPNTVLATEEVEPDTFVPDALELHALELHALEPDALAPNALEPHSESTPELIEDPLEEDPAVFMTAQEKRTARKVAKQLIQEAKLHAKAERMAQKQLLRAERKQLRLEKKNLAQSITAQTKNSQTKSARAHGALYQVGVWRATFRSSALFAGICVVLVAPLAATAVYKQLNSAREEVVVASQEAVDQLSAGSHLAGSLDFSQAQDSFENAQSSFRSAHDELLSVSGALTPLLRALPEAGDQFSSAENVLIAGEQISGAAEDVTQAFTVLSHINSDVIQEASTSQLGLTDILVIAHSALRPAAPRLERAALALQDVDVSHFPVEYQADLQLAKDTVPNIAASVRQLLALNETMLTILGHDASKRYLVVFQNNREMRATGGFIGSFATIDINKGQVKNLEIPGGGPYDLAGNFKERILSPQPLHYVNTSFNFWDANWWPDWPTSAQKLQWFYRKSGGTTVDGVISLTPDVIEQMLKVTGPISMADYAGTLSPSSESDVDAENTTEEDETADTTTADTDVDVASDTADTDDTISEFEQIGDFLVNENYEITADNFYQITQAQAERKFDDTTESKKFIADLTPKLLEKLFDLDVDNFVPVLQIFYNSLSEKDILVYFNDPFLQNEMNDLGWTGAMKQTDGDYLMVVDSNIAGGKTDQVIDQTIEHHTAIQSDGSIINTVTITRAHNGRSDNEFENVMNMDYVRVYVPEGSTLVSAEGFDVPDQKLLLQPEADLEPDEHVQAISGDTLIDAKTNTRINNELGKTVFGNWIQTQPGETSRVTLQYKLPFTIQTDAVLQPADTYSLYVQKQAGSYDPLVIHSIEYPTKYQLRWSYPANSDGQLHTELHKDSFVGVVLEQ